MSYTADNLESGVSQLDQQSVGEGETPSGAASGTSEPEDDEMSDAELDAVVGGLSVEAAIQRAAAFDARRHR